MQYADSIYDTVIIVDDDAIVNLIHQKVVQKTGTAKEIRPFTDPGKAKAYLSSQLARFDRNMNILVLLDINMPEMSGFEFIDSVLPLPGNGHVLDIVMVTSSIDYNDMERGLDSPLVSGYLTKPLVGPEILNFVRHRSRVSA